MVIGLDCLDPHLVFEEWADKLPNLTALAEKGCWGPLESTVPPITVPAWSCMMTSRDPGELGFYGFRNRSDYSYQELQFATSALVKEKRVWDILSDAGKRVIVLSVPQTYPPTPVNGYLVSCFLTPNARSEFTYPREFREEILDTVGEYLFDVTNFRSVETEQTIRNIYAMTDQRFALARHLLKTKPWDFFMMVDMGPDRIHHALWKYHDTGHSKHPPGNPHTNAIRDFYVHLDASVGELLQLADEDTAVFVVSDHGVQRMDGGICINEWLIQSGYLHLKNGPDEARPLRPEDVEWSRTTAWASGGYYGRVFLNVEGREAQGTIPEAEYESVRDQLAQEIQNIPDHRGAPIPTKIYKPDQVYNEVKGVPPDLMVYFGDLSWRAVGSVGLGTIHTFENDTGPDDANHARHGVFILRDPTAAEGGQRAGLHLRDVAPTILGIMGVDALPAMTGKIIT